MPSKLLSLLLCGALGFFGHSLLPRRTVAAHASGPSDLAERKSHTLPSTAGAIAQGSTSEEQLAKAMESAESWAATSQRLVLTRIVFRQIAEREGPLAAIVETCRRFEGSSVSGPARESAIEIAILAALEVGTPPDSQLATALTSYPESYRPFLRAVAFTKEGMPTVPLYERLSSISSGIAASEKKSVRLAILQAVIGAATNLQLTDLLQIATLTATEMSDDDATSIIAEACRPLNPELATDFLLERWKKEPLKAGDLVRRLGYSRAGLRLLYQKLPPSARDSFVQGCFPEYEVFPPDLYANLAGVISPGDLSMDARKRILSGLWFSGSGYVSTWLKQLPDPEKALTLNAGFPAIHGLPVSECLRDWLTATDGIKGIDAKLLGQTVGNLGRILPLAEVLPFADRLQPAEKKDALFLIYSLNIGKLGSKGLPAMLALVDSAPAELKGALKFSAFNHFAFSAPAEALETWKTSVDPSTKGPIERAFSEMGERLPPEIRQRWIQAQLADPIRLQQASPAINSYVADLLQADSETALNYAQSLPASPLREAALLHLATKWAQADPTTASEWIVDLPLGDTRDHALAALIKAAPDHPAEAIANALGIADQKLRLDALQGVVKWWSTFPLEPIQAAIAGSSLSESDKQMLLGQLRIGKPGP